jgi:broad specificity phosphatase PhoE
VLRCISVISKENPDKAILLVAHDGTINALRAAFTGEDIGTADLTRNPHDFVATFHFEDHKIVSFNEIA